MIPPTKITAILGTYRKDGVIDAAVEEISRQRGKRARRPRRSI